MPQYVEVKGQTIEFPDGMAMGDIEAAIKRNMMSIPPEKTAAPKISALEKVTQGLRDPIDGGAQLLTKILPDNVVKAGNQFNNWLADKTGLVGRLPEGGVDQQIKQNEAAYQAKRQAAGESGFDWYRVAGNVASPANLALLYATPAAATLKGAMAVGAANGVATSALAPTFGDDFAKEKRNQLLTGAIFGGATPAVVRGVGRAISPKASLNPDLQMLRKEGVRPTVGQTLGGAFNNLEEKAASIPLVGDLIAKQRRNAVEQFNKAAINRAVSKVGGSVDDVGTSGIQKAGDLISKSYDDALNQIKFVKFDKQFADDFSQLKSMTQGLTPEMRKTFNNKISSVMGTRTSGAGSMLADTFKKVDSELGGLASRYKGSLVASEQELGDAFLQAQSLLRQQAARSNPAASAALRKADSAYANLVRLEGAAKAAQNTDGIFTPGQLNTAVRAADNSVRKRAVSRGTALMQDLSSAGQNVLGNRVPNSGTADRLMAGALAAGATGLGVGSGFISPAAAGLLGAGAALYTNPVQGLLTSAIARRPEFAQSVAQALNKAAPSFSPFGVQIGAGLLNQ